MTTRTSPCLAQKSENRENEDKSQLTEEQLDRVSGGINLEEVTIVCEFARHNHLGNSSAGAAAPRSPRGGS